MGSKARNKVKNKRGGPEVIRIQPTIPATLERRLNVYAALNDKRPSEVIATLIEQHIPPVPEMAGKP